MNTANSVPVTTGAAIASRIASRIGYMFDIKTLFIPMPACKAGIAQWTQTWWLCSANTLAEHNHFSDESG